MLLRYTNSGRHVHPQSLQALKHTATGAESSISFPSVINFNAVRAIKSITFNDGSDHNVQLITAPNKEYSTANKFTGSAKKAYIKDGKMHFVNFTLANTNTIEVIAAFSNPTEITTSDGAFDKDTSIYPMPTELIPALTAEVLQKEYNIGLQQPRDKNIDGETPREEIQGQVRKR